MLSTIIRTRRLWRKVGYSNWVKGQNKGQLRYDSEAWFNKKEKKNVMVIPFVLELLMIKIILVNNVLKI